MANVPIIKAAAIENIQALAKKLERIQDENERLKAGLEELRERQEKELERIQTDGRWSHTHGKQGNAGAPLFTGEAGSGPDSPGGPA